MAAGRFSITVAIILVVLSIFPYIGFSAFSFDGTHAAAPYHSFDPNPAFALGSQFGISVWIKLSASSDYNSIVARVGPGGVSWTFRINKNGYLEWYHDLGIVKTGTIKVSDNVWHLVMIQAEADRKIHFYIDNVEDGSGVADSGWTNNFNFYIGSDNYGANVFPAGSLINDVRIWSTSSLTSAQRITLWNSGSGTGSALGDETLWYKADGNTADSAHGYDLTSGSKTAYSNVIAYFFCGDTLCRTGENCNNCFQDCSCSASQVCTASNVCLKQEEIACTSSSECSTGFCVHNKCRINNPFCGDDFCDSGETCNNCIKDCGCSDGRVCVQDLCKVETGAVCQSTSDCMHGFCVHEKCRTNETFCGDDFCDGGESVFGCFSDCKHQIYVPLLLGIFAIVACALYLYRKKQVAKGRVFYIYKLGWIARSEKTRLEEKRIREKQIRGAEAMMKRKSCNICGKKLQIRDSFFILVRRMRHGMNDGLCCKCASRCCMCGKRFLISKRKWNHTLPLCRECAPEIDNRIYGFNSSFESKRLPVKFVFSNGWWSLTHANGYCTRFDNVGDIQKLVNGDRVHIHRLIENLEVAGEKEELRIKQTRREVREESNIDVEHEREKLYEAQYSGRVRERADIGTGIEIEKLREEKYWPKAAEKARISVAENYDESFEPHLKALSDFVRRNDVAIHIGVTDGEILGIFDDMELSNEKQLFLPFEEYLKRLVANENDIEKTVGSVTDFFKRRYDEVKTSLEIERLEREKSHKKVVEKALRSVAENYDKSFEPHIKTLSDFIRRNGVPINMNVAADEIFGIFDEREIREGIHTFIPFEKYVKWLDENEGNVEKTAKEINDLFNKKYEEVMEKRKSEEAAENAHLINRISNEIKKFRPSSRYTRESGYHTELQGWLRKEFPNAKIEHQEGSSRPDIVINNIAIEVKGPTGSQELDTIPNKCMRYYEHFPGGIIVVLFDVGVNERMYDEWKRSLERRFPEVRVIRKN